MLKYQQNIDAVRYDPMKKLFCVTGWLFYEDGRGYSLEMRVNGEKRAVSYTHLDVYKRQACIFRSSFPRESWCAVSAALYLTWRWISGPIQKPMASGMG